jgi:FeS assembly SUF system protein
MPTLTPQERNAIEIEIVDTLCTVYDPEIPVNIYELGLIYDISVGKEGDVKVEMTLTSPGCPVAGTLTGEVEAKVRRVDGVTNAKVELVWEPAWSMDRMSDEAKLELGML